MKRLIDNIIRLLTAIPADKYMHCAVSAVIAAVALWLPLAVGVGDFFSFMCSFGAIAGVTVTKELYLDSEPNPYDAAANFVGAATVWVTFLICA